MFETWQSCAVERFDALKIDRERLLNSVDLVAGAIGQEWIDEQTERRERTGSTISDAHPLYRDLTSASDTSLVAVCELAEYLRSFLYDPALPEIIKDLRSEKYESTFFELAMAYRWQAADTEVRLQPSTPKGTADFEATIHGLGFVVEVSIFPADIFRDLRFRISSLITKIVGSTVNKEFPVAIHLQIRDVMPGDFEGAVRAEIREACLALIHNLRKGDNTVLSREAAFGTIQVEQITESTETIRPTRGHFSATSDPGARHWDVCFRAVSKRVPHGVPVYRAMDDEAEEEHVRVFVNFPRSEVDPYDRIVKKIKKEARQLRGIESARVVVLDVAGIAYDALDLHMDHLRDELVKLMKATPELACVWLMSRGWSTELRYQYRGVYIANAESVYQLPTSFLQSLMVREWRWDFLGSREIPVLTEEEALLERQRRSRQRGPD